MTTSVKKVRVALAYVALWVGFVSDPETTSGPPETAMQPEAFRVVANLL
jgi:hypothetical protein